MWSILHSLVKQGRGEIAHVAGETVSAEGATMRAANDAPDQYTRTKFESEGRLWLEIAAAIEKDERPNRDMLAHARGQPSTT
jgi:hypothetical protein